MKIELLKYQKYQEDMNDDAPAAGEEETQGRWITSVGRYFIRVANQLLVEDEEIDGEKDYSYYPNAIPNADYVKGKEETENNLKNGNEKDEDVDGENVPT